MSLLVYSLAVTFLSPLAYFIWMHSSRLQRGDADALIILGYRCYGDRPNPLLKERLDTALELLGSHRYNTVILSGGAVASDRTEAEIMQQYLLGKGVPERFLVMEAYSRNTVQNMAHCRLIMAERGLRTCQVVSNSFHIRRMKYIMRKLGMPAMFYAKRTPFPVIRQWSVTWHEIRAFRLTLPWLAKVSGIEVCREMQRQSK